MTEEYGWNDAQGIAGNAFPGPGLEDLRERYGKLIRAYGRLKMNTALEAAAEIADHAGHWQIARDIRILMEKE